LLGCKLDLAGAGWRPVMGSSINRPDYFG